MRIKNISCKQFAGVQNQNIPFAEGINVIFGKNESGKSTLVNLLSRTLFQDAKVGLQKDKDKEFRKLYLPIQGDFADGEVVLETENGIYTVEKKWGSKTDCTIYTPNGAFSDQGKINEILRELLVYGEGVYSDMLFSSQRNADISLQSILDASRKTDAKQEIADAVSLAFAESDGVSVDVIEQAIFAKIEEISGKHWDAERSLPERKAGGGRHQKQIGKILEAYYALEDAKSVLEKISGLEVEADHAANNYLNAHTAFSTAEEAYERFNKFYVTLVSQSLHKKDISRKNADLLKIKEILSHWPEFTKAIEKAKALQTEKSNRELIDMYHTAKKYLDGINYLNGGIANKICPEDNEISLVKKAQRAVNLLENKLCGMNINAVLNMFNQNTVEIISLRTGEKIDISNGAVSITEAVKITVPNVMEMQLSPADVDVAGIEEQIAEQRKIIADIFTKYKVQSVEELENIVKTITDTKARIQLGENQLSVLLGDITYEELERLATAITTEIRSKEVIENDILSVCKNNDVARFIAEKETIVAGFKKDYGSINELEIKVCELQEDIKKLQQAINEVNDIPNEYQGISDPDTYLNGLQNDLKFKNELREKSLIAKTQAVSNLESYREGLFGDPVEDKEKAERVFNEWKELLCHWLHIAEVFKAQKENIKNNPMQDIADRFTYYLGYISDGKISSEFPEADKLNMNIYSSNKLLDYGKLSEGTKETVSLAFRLAVLDHLFPNGGGVIVFDDPFTDMDAERMAKSCELVKKCAEHHQVIFLTCREEYFAMLGGNKVLF